MKGLAVVSGGMDSVSMLYQYQEQIEAVVNFNYGSKHNDIETTFAVYHAQLLNKAFYSINLPFIGSLFKSDLLKSGAPVPHGHYEDESMKATVVPFRNGIMLSIAIGLAESLGLEAVYIGNHAGDHAIYPDCRNEFIMAMRKAAIEGTYLKVNIISPFCHATKRDIAKIGTLAGADLAKTYSCYEGQEIHCGKCGTCVERKEALLGFDRTIYRD